MKLRPDNAEWDEIDRISDRILRRRNIDELRAYLASGQYEHYTLMDCRDGVAEGDLFYEIVRGNTVHAIVRGRSGHDKFLLEAFKAFVDDGSVFRKPYGMLAVLWRAYTYASTMYMIIVTLIPDETWREMATVVVNATVPGTIDPFGFPGGHFQMLVMTCLRWGRGAITLEQAAALRAYLERARARVRPGVIYHEPTVEFWDASELHREEIVLAVVGRAPQVDDWSPEYIAGVRELLEAARKRACYRDLYNLVLGLVGANIDPNSLLEVVGFGLPCIDAGYVTRIEVVRLIDRVRAARYRAEDRSAERNVERAVE